MPFDFRNTLRGAALLAALVLATSAQAHAEDFSANEFPDPQPGKTE